LNSVILVGVTLFLFLKTRIPTPVAAALSLILCGGIGNLIDRIVRDGRVVDFMNMGIGTLRTGVFNVADLGIVGGLLLLVVLELFKPKESPVDTGSPEDAAP
jgi:signal peptidase II